MRRLSESLVALPTRPVPVETDAVLEARDRGPQIVDQWCETRVTNDHFGRAIGQNGPDFRLGEPPIERDGHESGPRSRDNLEIFGPVSGKDRDTRPMSQAESRESVSDFCDTPSEVRETRRDSVDGHQRRLVPEPRPVPGHDVADHLRGGLV